MRRENYIWGLLLIVLGGLLLLDNLGLLPGRVNAWGLFWPLVLIGLGLRALIPVFWPQPAGSESLTIPLEAARSARLKVRHGAGELRIQAGAAAGSLLEGSFEGGVVNQVNRGSDSADVELRLPDANFEFVTSGVGRTWNVSLTPSIPLSLDLEVGASRNILNLRDLVVTNLRIVTGASSTELDLPANAGETRVQIQSGAASVHVRIPQGVAARINAHGGLASIQVDTTRFPQVGGVYQSSEFASAENRVDLEIETGAGSVTVN